MKNLTLVYLRHPGAVTSWCTSNLWRESPSTCSTPSLLLWILARALGTPINMGCNFSKRHGKIPKYRDCAALASETLFTVNEIEALYVLYKELSSSIIDDGLIHRVELRQALLRNSRKPNLFVDKLFEVFDLKKNGVIEFEEFVRSLNVFHPNAPEAEKILYVFNLYDLRGTGYIEREEVKTMILATLEELNVTLQDDLVEEMIDKTFMEADSKGDGKIDQEEWKEFVAKYPSLLKVMTLPDLREITTLFPCFMCETQVPDSDLATEVESDPVTEPHESPQLASSSGEEISVSS